MKFLDKSEVKLQLNIDVHSLQWNEKGTDLEGFNFSVVEKSDAYIQMTVDEVRRIYEWYAATVIEDQKTAREYDPVQNPLPGDILKYGKKGRERHVSRLTKDNGMTTVWFRDVSETGDHGELHSDLEAWRKWTSRYKPTLVERGDR